MKRKSTLPVGASPCTNEQLSCVGGERQGQLCGGVDANCGAGGVCDACAVRGGVTTEDEMLILLGNYYGQPSHAVTPLEGIRKAVSEKTKVVAARGAALLSVDVVPVPASELVPPDAKAGDHGLRAEYFANRDLSGAPAVTRVDPELSFN